MAPSLATTASASAAAASAAKTAPKHTSYSPFRQRHCYNSPSKVSFRVSPKPRLRFSSKCLRTSFSHSTVVKAQLNEDVMDESSHAAATPSKSDISSVEAKDAKSSSEPSPTDLASEESISEFITQVGRLVKLVDSKDIVELQLKQLDRELLIRKKEALPQPPPLVPVATMQSPPPPPVAPPAFQAASPAVPSAPSSPALSSSQSPTPSPAAAKPTKSSLPSLKCPMAGTFYRSPGPGEPPFVKVGDKVQKGQVLCIIEAMKLMNEIEADQSGTIVEILVEDGKSVSVETPLFVIEP